MFIVIRLELNELIIKKALKLVNVKVCVLGMGGVGKTSIIQIFSGQQMGGDYAPTIGTDFTVKDFDYKSGAINERIRFMIYD